MKSVRISGEQLAANYGVDNAVTRVLPIKVEPVFKYEDNERTDEQVAQKLNVVFEGIAADSVKLPLEVDVSKLKAYQQIAFENLEGAEVNNTLYWRATGVRVLKEEGAGHE